MTTNRTDPSLSSLASRRLAPWILALSLISCTAFSDPEAIHRGDDVIEENTCTPPSGEGCPPGMTLEDAANTIRYGVCDPGEGVRYLRDLTQETVGLCNGTEDCGGYLCVQRSTEDVCEGVEVGCASGRVVVARDEINAPCDENNQIFDGDGVLVAECRRRGDCEYLCVPVFTQDCACTQGALGACLPCEGCDEAAGDLPCGDGSCVLKAEVTAACEASPGMVLSCPDIVRCVWYTRDPPASCSPEVLQNYLPTASTVDSCTPDDLFCCVGGSPCFSAVFTCDGAPDCPNGEDEDPANCEVTSVCEVGQFLCLDAATCINDMQLCDATADCPDADDERPESCLSGCLPEEFACQDGACLPPEALCDGTPDCPDEPDDENPLLCGCGDGFQCTTSGQCLAIELRCDASIACLDGSDEVGCGECAEDQLTCADGACVPLTARCDDVPDCSGGLDEMGCPAPMDCEGMFECGDGSCVAFSTLCDETPDCADSSDEATSLCCGPGMFACDDAAMPPVCINTTSVCDGLCDCPAGEDEQLGGCDNACE